MKNRLLALMALCGFAPCTSPSWAAEWADPTLEFAQPDLEGIQAGQKQVYYIYNVASGKFMSDGGQYGTQLVVLDTGQDVTVSYGSDYELVAHEGEADFSDAKSYRLSMMNALTNGGFHEVWTNGSVCYVDHNKQGHMLWDIVPQDGGVYHIRVNADDPTYGTNSGNPDYLETWMMTVRKTGGWDQVVYPLAKPGTAGYDRDSIGLDWQFVTPQVYEVYIAKKNVLKPELEAADAAGFTDYAEYKGVYEKSSATVEEVESAAEKLKNAVLDYVHGGASEGNPADVTSLIANASLSDGTTGWETWRASTNNNFQIMPDASQVTVSDGTSVKFFERWVPDGTPQGDWYIQQELSGMPDGKYRLGAYIMTRQTAAPTGLFLFAKTLAGESKKEADQYSTGGEAYAAPYTVDFSVIGGTATIGMRSEGAPDNWSAVGNFTLKYMGKEGSTTMRDALAQGISDAETQYAEDIQPKKHSQSADKKYQDMIAAAEAAHADGALGDDALRSALESLQLCMDSLAQDVADYETLSQKIEELNTAWEESAFASQEFPAYDEFLGNLETAYGDGTFDPAELDSIQPRSDRIWAECVREALLNGDVSDATSLLTNPDFENGGTGWTATGTVGTNNYNHSVGESWNGRDWEIYQEIGNLPEGSYKITAQAFYRPGAGGDAENITEWQTSYGQEGDELNKVRAYVFGNDGSKAIHHIVDFPQEENVGDGCLQIAWTEDASLFGKWLPDNTTAVQAIFEADPSNYLNETVCYVGSDGKLRLGMKMSGVTFDVAWVPFDSFRLTYLGADDFSGATSTLEALIASAQELLAQEGVVTTQEAKDGLNAAIQAASEAAGSLTSETFKEVSEGLTAAIEAYNEAVAAASALETKATNHDNKLTGGGDDSYDEYTGTDGFNELEGLVIEILEEKIGGEGIFASLAEIEDYSVKLDKAYSKMLCSNVDFGAASKSAPVDATALIVNPSFQFAGLNDAGETVDNPTSDGWTIAGEDVSHTKVTSACVFEIYKDSSSVYQKLYGMPAGYYHVAYNGFYREGGDGPIPGALIRRDSMQTLNAEVYLEANDKAKWSEKLGSIFDNVRELKYDESDVVMPDSLFPDMPELLYHCIVDQVAGADAAFKDGAYEGGFSFRVEEGEEPVLGVRKTGVSENDWTCFDNFRLRYYGEGDSNKPDDFTSSVEDAVAGGAATVTSTAWYTIGGVRVAGPKQRGVYIRQDKMSDGTSRTVKVMVR